MTEYRLIMDMEKFVELGSLLKSGRDVEVNIDGEYAVGDILTLIGDSGGVCGIQVRTRVAAVLSKTKICLSIRNVETTECPFCGGELSMGVGEADGEYGLHLVCIACQVAIATKPLPRDVGHA